VILSRVFCAVRPPPVEMTSPVPVSSNVHVGVVVTVAILTITGLLVVSNMFNTVQCQVVKF